MRCVLCLWWGSTKQKASKQTKEADSKFEVIFVSRAMGGLHTNSSLIIYVQIILHMQVRTHCIYV